MESSEVQPPAGADLILSERARQLAVEGWTPEHDDDATEAQLVRAAICYADFGARLATTHDEKWVPRWPWAQIWWKPERTDPIRNLVKAGALIAAEIDRLQRAKARNS